MSKHTIYEKKVSNVPVLKIYRINFRHDNSISLTFKQPNAFQQLQQHCADREARGQEITSVYEALVPPNQRMSPCGYRHSWHRVKLRTKAYHQMLQDAISTMAQKPEIQSLMTLSTAHVSIPTIALLQEATQFVNALLNNAGIAVYAKTQACGTPDAPSNECYGWFVYLPRVIPAVNKSDIPADLLGVRQYAQNHGCQILCLDSDGPIVATLKTYDRTQEV